MDKKCCGESIHSQCRQIPGCASLRAGPANGWTFPGKEPRSSARLANPQTSHPLGMEHLFPNRGRSEVVILDGGSGTTLSDEFGCRLASQLWSSELLIDRPQVLSILHQAWELAGAQIISTASYQATVPGFASLLSQTNRSMEERSSESLRLLRASVKLARGSLTRDDSRIALSLGPFGATLVPGQEYTGSYPSPYDKRNKLVEFHFNRLMAYAEDNLTWDAVDIVLFETIPNLVEARAIREAWKKLESHATSFDSHQSPSAKNHILSAKPWIISFVFPGSNDGRFPTGETAIEVLKAALDSDPKLADPSGIGINCTKLQHLVPILQDWTSNDHIKSGTWLWLYPDGGPTYDSVKRAWSGYPITPEEWAHNLLKVANEFSRHWTGLVLGGCCKAGTSHIRALRQLTSSASKPPACA